MNPNKHKVYNVLGLENDPWSGFGVPLCIDPKSYPISDELTRFRSPNCCRICSCRLVGCSLRSLGLNIGSCKQ